MIRVAGVNHVHLHVADVERSIDFYRKAFGAAEAFRVGHELVFVQLPGAKVIVALDGRSEGARNPQHVGLTLDEGQNLDEAVLQIERAGGNLVERSEHAPGVPYAYVADPDGNVLEL